MDQALTTAARAGSLAVEELTAKGREFNQRELKQALDQIKRMEHDFLDTVRQVSQSTSGTVRGAWGNLLSNAQRGGTETGVVVSHTLRDFGILHEHAAAGRPAQFLGHALLELPHFLIAGDARRNITTPMDLHDIDLRHASFLTMLQDGPLGQFRDLKDR
jgi:hypothetical protein